MSVLPGFARGLGVALGDVVAGRPGVVLVAVVPGLAGDEFVSVRTEVLVSSSVDGTSVKVSDGRLELVSAVVFDSVVGNGISTTS